MGDGELEAIEARLEKTLAPTRWRYDPALSWVYAALGGIPGDVGIAHDVGDAEGVFIARAPADVAALLAEVRRLRAALVEERAWRGEATAPGAPDDRARARARDQLRAEGMLPG